MKEKKYKEIVNSINDINKLLKEMKVYLPDNATKRDIYKKSFKKK